MTLRALRLIWGIISIMGIAVLMAFAIHGVFGGFTSPYDLYFIVVGVIMMVLGLANCFYSLRIR